MSSSSVILVGPMGSGKSTVGRALADRENMNHVDLDELIVRSSGMTVPEIFSADGESGFRALESDALHSALVGAPAVISTGGGVVTSESNRIALQRSGALVVWLDAVVEVLARRVGDGATRPLLAGNDVERALRVKVVERAGLYQEVADIRIDTSDTAVTDCVDFIVAARLQDVSHQIPRPTQCR